jgi:3-oxoacyl-[acyl-carrier-protein] synthase II
MRMKAYINNAAIVSPQRTFDQDFPMEIVSYAGAKYLKCIEPAYKEFIDPMVSRRMSRIVKMGVCSALKCLRKAGVEMPDAVIAGTGLGCLEDTEKFLGSIYTLQEHLLNPTPFINSTHNTIAGAIALAIKCHGYNATFTHRGFSFESALLDALMLAEENPEAAILAGAFDEITAVSYDITKRLGLWDNAIPGEGVAFFMLSGKKQPGSLARLNALQTLFNPGKEIAVEKEMHNFIKNAGLSVQDIDLVMMGINGDPLMDGYYKHLMSGLFEGKPVAEFKHLCGEYDTTSSFALWLSAEVIHKQHVPEWIRVNALKPGKLKNIVIYNHLRGINHSFYLLSAC